MPLAPNNEDVAVVGGVLYKFEVVVTVAPNEGRGAVFDTPNKFFAEVDVNTDKFFCVLV